MIFDRGLFITAVALVSLVACRASAQTESTEYYDGLDSKYRVKLESKESRLTFGAYTQFSSFQKDGTNLAGWTIEVPVNYALTDDLAVQVAINQSLSMSGGFSVLYTGFHFGAAWAFSGQFTQKKSDLIVNGVSTMSVSTLEKDVWALEAGIDQILFNGVGRIVPATGLSAGIRSDFSLWGYRTSAMFRYGALVINNEPVSLMTTGIGLLLRY